MNFVRITKFPTRYGIVRFNSTTKNTKHSPHHYCMNLVRSHDYENYLSTLLIKGPNERRNAFAVRAFNVEIAKIAGAVSDEKLGQMRLKFWSDAVNRIFDKSTDKALPDHPVILELNNVINKHKLSKVYFQRLIQSRHRPSNAMFLTIDELEQYVEQSTASTYYLLLKSSGVEDINADHAASHLGKAQGICNMLRTLTAVNSKRSHGASLGLGAIPPIPQEILLKHGCSYERIIRQKPDDVGVQNCVFDVAGTANIHLEMARKLSDKLSKSAKTILLPSIAVDRFLNRLRLVNFHLYNEKLTKRDGLLPLIYYWNNLRRKY